MGKIRTLGTVEKRFCCVDVLTSTLTYTLMRVICATDLETCAQKFSLVLTGFCSESQWMHSKVATCTLELFFVAGECTRHCGKVTKTYYIELAEALKH